MSGPRFDDDLNYWVDNPDESEYERAVALCARLRRLDVEYDTDRCSPLHHDSGRCPLHP